MIWIRNLRTAQLGGVMHVISRKKFKQAALRHPDLATALDAWFRIAKKASWRNLMDVRSTFASADAVDKWTVFNIKRNKYRMITEIHYKYQRLYILHVLTHAEYDQEKWKNEPGNQPS